MRARRGFKMADMLRELLEREFPKSWITVSRTSRRPGSASGGRAREAMGQVLAGAAVEPHAGAEFPRAWLFRSAPSRSRPNWWVKRSTSWRPISSRPSTSAVSRAR